MRSRASVRMDWAGCRRHRMVPAVLVAALAMAVTPSVHATSEKHLEDRVADLEASIERHGKKQESTKDQIAELKALVTAQAEQIAALRAALTEEIAARQQATAGLLASARGYTEQMVNPLAEKLAPVSRQGNDLFITGANLHIVNGTGSTTQPNGLGNLIVGYNEPRDANALQIGADNRNGSHNVVVGTMNNFSSCAGLVVGSVNESSSLFCAVSGGQFNRALGFCSSVSGGAWNTANHYAAVVSGGFMNFSGARCSSVSGGQSNRAMGQYSSISGGSGVVLGD